MGFLQKLLNYKTIVLQCHNNPDSDTLASAYGIYLYLKSQDKDVKIIYGGPNEIKRSNMKRMVEECQIPVEYVTEMPMADLLVTVDCQYGFGNVARFDAHEIAIVDHHVQMVEENPLYLIKSHYQSCSTIVFELLEEEDFPVKENLQLKTALQFGLYIDTSLYSDLYYEADMNMKRKLQGKNTLLERMIKSNMTVAELLIIGDALNNHYMDFERKYMLIPAINCDQAVLGLISDLVIQVDSCDMAIVYTQTGNGYQFSIRGCSERLSAKDLAIALADGIGSGGGHNNKSGGRLSLELMEQKYKKELPQDSVKEIINERICNYIDTVKSCEKS